MFSKVEKMFEHLAISLYTITQPAVSKYKRFFLVHLHFQEHIQAFVGGLLQRHTFTALPCVRFTCNLAFFLLLFVALSYAVFSEPSK